MTAYKFLRSDHRSGYGNEPPWAIGEKRTATGPLELCHNGYHYSKSASDALCYAPGPVLAHVEMGEERIDGADKGCVREMTVVAMRDVSRELREFACDCAERALRRRKDAGKATDERSWTAVRVSRAYARGEATLDELQQAQVAASVAAFAFADAASAAAYAAATYATYAAYAAATYAAYAAYADDNAVADDNAAYDAAADAERAWQRAHLADLLGLDVGEKRDADVDRFRKARGAT